MFGCHATTNEPIRLFGTQTATSGINITYVQANFYPRKKRTSREIEKKPDMDFDNSVWKEYKTGVSIVQSREIC